MAGVHPAVTARPVLGSLEVLSHVVRNFIRALHSCDCFTCLQVILVLVQNVSYEVCVQHLSTIFTTAAYVEKLTGELTIVGVCKTEVLV